MPFTPTSTRSSSVTTGERASTSTSPDNPDFHLCARHTHVHARARSRVRGSIVVMTSYDWNAQTYAENVGFVPELGRTVLDLLDPQGHELVLDLGCGTGRALRPLRALVGPAGRVFGLDATMAMIGEALRLGRAETAALLHGDVLSLPFADGSVEVLFAGGLLPHLADPAAGLRELARVTRPGAQLAVFHPIGRVALAARHHQVPSDDDVIAFERLQALGAAAGWTLISVDDTEDRYLAHLLRQ